MAQIQAAQSIALTYQAVKKPKIENCQPTTHVTDHPAPADYARFQDFKKALFKYQAPGHVFVALEMSQNTSLVRINSI